MIIVITGSTGTIGHEVAEKLLAKKLDGVVVRAGVHHLEHEESKKLKELGAELCAMDFDKPETLDVLFKDADIVFLLTPLTPRIAEEEHNSITSLKKAGVKHVVMFSNAGSNPDGNELARPHGLADRETKECGIPYTILKPTFFMDDIIKYWKDEISKQGKYWGASGEGAVAYVASDDVSDCVVEVITNHEKFAGKEFVLKGPVALKEAEIAQFLTKQLGKPVEYVNLSLDEYRKFLTDGGAPPHLIELGVLMEEIKLKNEAAETSTGVKDIIGRDAMGYEEWLKLHISEF